jgi:hypothetical protein
MRVLQCCLIGIWELRDISTDAPAKDLFRPSANFIVLSPDIPRQ